MKKLISIFVVAALFVAMIPTAAFATTQAEIGDEAIVETVDGTADSVDEPDPTPAETEDPDDTQEEEQQEPAEDAADSTADKQDADAVQPMIDDDPAAVDVDPEGEDEDNTNAAPADGDGTTEVNPGAEQGTMEPKVVIKINGKEVQPGEVPAYTQGDEIEVSLVWDNIPDGALKSEYKFELGKDVLFAAGQGGGIPDTTNPNHATLGDWAIDENGILTITLEDYFTSVDAQNRRFQINIKGQLNLGKPPASGNENRRFEIAGTEFHFDVEYTDTTITLEKKMSPIVNDLEKKKFISHVTVTATVNGYANNITFLDEMGDKLFYDAGSVNITYQNGDPFEGSFTVNPIDEHSFELILDGDVMDDTLIITYDVEIDNELMAKWENYKLDQDAKTNKISGHYQDATSIPDKDVVAPSVEVDITGPRLVKDGTMEDQVQADGSIKEVIVYLITYNTGSYGRITQETLDRLGIEGLDAIDFHDTLSPGQGFGVNGKDGQELDFSFDPKRWTYDEKQEEDGTWTYTFKYTVTITDPDIGNYSNDVTTGSGSLGGMHQTAHKGIIGYDMDPEKTFLKANDDEDTMTWEVKVKIPEDNVEYDKFVITDTPQDDKDNKQLFTHRLVKETIVMEVQDEAGNVLATLKPETDDLTGLGITCSTSDNGFTITIQHEGAFAKQYASADGAVRNIVIRMDTEAVAKNDDEEDDRTGSMQGDFDWWNQVKVSLYNGSDHRSQTRTAHYQKTGLPGLQKTAVQNKEKGTFTWRIRVTGQEFLKVDANGNVSGNYASMTADIFDALPEHLFYLPGSAKMILMDSNGDDCSVEGYETILADGLAKVNYDKENDPTNLELHWKGTDIDTAALAGLFKNTGANSYDLVFEFETEIDRDSDFLLQQSDKKISFQNKATGKIGDEFYGPTFNVQDYDVKSTIKKSALTDPSVLQIKDEEPFWYAPDGNFNIRYQIEINPEALNFDDHDFDQLELVDKMEKNLLLLENSVRLYEHESPADTGMGTLVERKDYHLAYDMDTNTMTLRLQTGKYYTLVYYCTALGKGNLGNTVKLDGIAEMEWETEDTPNSAVSSGADGSSGTPTFLIQKYTNDEEEGMTHLSNAKFELVPVVYDAETDTFTENGTPIIGDFNNTDATQTVFSFKYDPEDPGVSGSEVYINQLFRLTEIQSPEGYVRSSEPLYFYFADHCPVDPDGLPDYVKQFILGVTYLFENEPGNPGDLEVTKTVVDEDGNEKDNVIRAFHFKVTLNVPITGTYGEMEFEDGVAEFDLKHGESCKAIGLPVSAPDPTTYTVEETPVKYYTPNDDGIMTGEIDSGEKAEANFVNVISSDAGDEEFYHDDDGKEGDDKNKDKDKNKDDDTTGMDDKNKDKDKNVNENGDNVATGDNTPIALWITSMAAAIVVVGGAALLIVRKRKA